MIEFRILGSLEVLVEGRPVRVGFGRQRTLLAVLLLRANQFVGFDELVEAIWGDAAPENPRAAVHTCVTRLRKVLGGLAVIESSADGVRIVVDEGDVDLGRFESVVRSARAAGAEVEVLRDALGLWRGEPLADVQSDYLRREVVPRLVERRLQVFERVLDLELRVGRFGSALPDLHELAAANPLRESLWAQLMTALYGSGRQAEALLAYSEIRGRLVEELGVEPGDDLRRAHQAVLAAGGDGKSTWRVECQLPLDVADFVGRDSELDHLLDSFRAPAGIPVVTISGPPGMGKSALAVRAAHRLVDDYPDGQWFLRLNGASQNPRSPSDLLAELLRTAGVNPAAFPNGVDGRAALLRSRLADRRVLLLLDDAGSVEQVAPLLPGRPGCAVVVTSRSELAGIAVLYGGHRLSLKPLASQQAYDLLARIVGLRRCGEDEDSAVELTDLCGRLPLALRIAAANLASRPSMGIGRYAEDLRSGDRLAKLRTRGESGVAVRAAFDVSYTALDDQARRGFRLLGLVAGTDISAAGAAALFGCSIDDAVDVLDRLVAANLLESQYADRFRFHDLIRMYAADRARADEPAGHRDPAFRRLAEWYLHGVHAAVSKCLASLYISPLGPVPEDIEVVTFEEDEHAIEWLDSERQNYLAVIERTAVAGPVEYTWKLTDAARPDLQLRYRLGEQERAAGLGLSCARMAGNRRGEAMMLLAAGAMKSISARYEESITDLAECARIAVDIGETGVRATAVISLAALYLESGRPAEGARAAEDALGVVDQGVEQGEARRISAMAQLGDACCQLGRLPESVEVLTSAVAKCVEIKSPMSHLIVGSYLGEVHRQAGDYGQALRIYEHLVSSSLFRHVVHEEVTAGLAALYCDMGQLDLALQFATEALAKAQHSGYGKYEARATLVLGSIYLFDSRSALALDQYRRAHELARSSGASSTEIEALTGMAVAGGRREFAVDAVALARQRGMRLLEAHALTALAEVDFSHGRTVEARDAGELALAMHRECGCRPGEAQALMILARLRQAGELGFSVPDGR